MSKPVFYDADCLECFLFVNAGYIESLDIELITSSMILSIAVEKEIISLDSANELWKGMLDKGIELPKDSFSDYFDELYERDCKRFLKCEM